MVSKLSFFRYSMLFLAIFSLLAFPALMSAALQSLPTEFLKREFEIVRLASNDSGQAILIVTEDQFISAYNYSEGAWSVKPTFFIDDIDPISSIEMAMDATGSAIVVWVSHSGAGGTAYFNGTAWGIPSNNPLEANSSCVSVAMDRLGQGVAVWIENGIDVRSSFFSENSWSFPHTIGTGLSTTSVAYSSNGTAVAGWDDLDVTVANFIGFWHLPQQLDPNGIFKGVGIDANGKALALWETMKGDVVASTFNGSFWILPPQKLVDGPGNFGSAFSMSSGGTAVAVWEDARSNGFSSSYNGNSWSLPFSFSLEILSTPSTISANRERNALVIFVTSSFQVKRSRLPLAGIWRSEVIMQAASSQNGLQNLFSLPFLIKGLNFPSGY